MSKTVIIVHHAGKNGENSSFRSIKNWHTTPKPNGNGWTDIGYHIVIEKNGSVCRGRADTQPGAHTVNWNQKALGICLCGNFDHQVVSLAQWNSLIEQVANWCLEHGIVPSNETVVGHRDKQPTKTIREGNKVHSKPNTCPGKNLYSRLNSLRAEVTRRLQTRQSIEV